MDLHSKEKKYQLLLKQINSVLKDENNTIAKMASICCMLKQEFSYYYWCGFYIVDQESAKKEELVIGPYQGTLGCLRIPFGKGVCGVAAKSLETQIVEDVHKIDNHIACDSASNSEIVVPVIKNGKLIAVLDVDSTSFGAFDHIDQQYLEKLLSESF